MLLAKSKLNSIEVLISMVLIDSNISHDEFILINNVPKEFYDIKKEIKKFNSKFKPDIRMLSYCLKCRKNTGGKNQKVVTIKNGRIMLLSKCAACVIGKNRDLLKKNTL